MNIVVVLAITVIVIGIVAFAINSLVKALKKEKEKVDSMSSAEREKYFREHQERKDKAMYNDLKYTCPMCGSHKIKNISTSNRGLSVALFGASSGKIGRLYECDDCKYKW